MNEKKPIVFFDGECGLCDSFISFLFKHDKDQYFLAAPLQGESAKHYLSKNSQGKLSTVILFEEGKEYVKSDAVLRIFKRLGPPWSIVSLFAFIPKAIRDMIYDLVAANRHRFSKSSCRLPTQSEKERILN